MPIWQANPTFMSSTATNLPAGHQLCGYRIESVLGEGTFGVTYLALDTRSGLKVALKEYLPADYSARALDKSVYARTKADASMFNWGLRRFADEARVLSALRHPAIVRLLGYFESSGTGYMVMEWVQGVPLSLWADGRRPLQQHEILRTGEVVLEGLQVIHGSGYLHRDLKPANILIQDNGCPVLLDFGSAREATGERMTSLVSPGYAPLEQYTELGKQGPWTDIYALGGVLYWMVTGKRPVEAAARVRKDIMTPASAYLQAYPACPYAEGFLKAIDWALAPNEQKRPQSASELLDALRGVQVPAPTPQQDSPAPSPPVADAPFPPDLLKRMESAAARELGPIAPIIVRNASRKSSTIPQLCGIVADNIKDETARAEFLKQFAGKS